MKYAIRFLEEKKRELQQNRNNLVSALKGEVNKKKIVDEIYTVDEVLEDIDESLKLIVDGAFELSTDS